jgi:peptidoglycan/xylan/chitin deacetylase (PgdA/CDA1 family)
MLRILTYHRVAELQQTPTLDPHLISATPAAFATQMHYLARHYEVLSLEQVVQAVTTGLTLPKRAVLLTFDDAYADFGDTAWPILQQYRLPATLFVPTAYPDHPERAFWWDRLYQAVTGTTRTQVSDTPLGTLSLATSEQRRESFRRLRQHLKTLPHAESMDLLDEICAALDYTPVLQKSVLGWDELRQLAREGVILAAHTQTHALLTQLPLAQIREEVRASQQDVQREIGCVLPVFCYPGGSHDEQVVSVLQQEGFVMAFTTRHGVLLPQRYARNQTAFLRLRRINITRRTSLPLFRMRLWRCGVYVDMWRQQGTKRLWHAGIHRFSSPEIIK